MSLQSPATTHCLAMRVDRRGLTDDRAPMKFRWDQPIPAEWTASKPPPVWTYLLLFVVVECVAVGLTVATWPQGKSVVSADFARYVLLVPLAVWLAFCIALHRALYGGFAFEAAVKNSARRNLLNRWHQLSRRGVAVLDSVILTPEADLGERMLSLEGKPPENPGKVMALGGLDSANGLSRVHAMLEQLLIPLTGKLTRATRSGSFEIVIQCERAESSVDVRTVWECLDLPGRPRIRWMNNDAAPAFADAWFEDDSYAPYASASLVIDRTPRYRLLLAWHLNDDGPDGSPQASESAVALLFGSAALLDDKPGIKQQAWLLRQRISDAVEVDESLALLLRAQQVPHDRIRHFWHSRLKGLSQHATVGAVRDTGLKVEEHALDPAIGPQAPVARWIVQALAAKMAHFGQGAQLVALAHGSGVALNLVAKQPSTLDVPWKAEYGYSLFPGAELATCFLLWVAMLLLCVDEQWGTAQTVATSVCIFLAILFAGARFMSCRFYAGEIWRKYG
ncbi:hypothetical protein [Paraburkholderia sp. HD33-4]|uniref:hypothetical protein n=1 Tax=Paraburkholderia sp. HD33-4 TaxID=2883242 RepID=UPI003FA39B80